MLIPKFLTLFSDARPQVRMYSIACVNHFVPLLPDALLQHMDAYLQHLFAVATDASEEVRKRVGQARVMLLEVQLEKLIPHMNNVVQYMLMATSDSDELVALEACEFWSAICETKVAKEALREAGWSAEQREEAVAATQHEADEAVRSLERLQKRWAADNATLAQVEKEQRRLLAQARAAVRSAGQAEAEAAEATASADALCAEHERARRRAEAGASARVSRPLASPSGEETP